MFALGGERALADIIVWHDANGGVHYTNSLDGVPADRREEAATFVKERPRAAPEPEPTPTVPEVAAATPAPLMSEDAMEDRLIRAFAAGVEAANQAAGEEGAEVEPSTMVQTTEVLVEAPERDAIVVGGFAPQFPVRRRPREPDVEPEDEEEAPFIVGPAGPPPIGAAGPPPIE